MITMDQVSAVADFLKAAYLREWQKPFSGLAHSNLEAVDAMVKYLEREDNYGLRPKEETSYPYLHIARTFGVDYGDVLSYVDYMLSETVLTSWHTTVLTNLPIKVRGAITNYIGTGELP